MGRAPPANRPDQAERSPYPGSAAVGDTAPVLGLMPVRLCQFVTRNACACVRQINPVPVDSGIPPKLISSGFAASEYWSMIIGNVLYPLKRVLIDLQLPSAALLPRYCEATSFEVPESPLQRRSKSCTDGRWQMLGAVCHKQLSSRYATPACHPARDHLWQVLDFLLPAFSARS